MDRSEIEIETIKLEIKIKQVEIALLESKLKKAEFTQKNVRRMG